MDDARKCDQILLEHAGDPHFPDTLPPLFGVPVAVKNNLLVKGRQTVCASRMLRNYVAPYSATCVNKLKEAGATIMTCGTCLDFYGLKDKLQVGIISNMYDIVEAQMGASLIIRP